MVILHIASIINSSLTGVSVAVPEHLRAQSIYADVALINIRDEIIDNIPYQIRYNKPFNIDLIEQSFRKPDLVIFHECYRIDYIVISEQLRKKQIPYVIIPHGELRRESQKEKCIKKMIANFLLFNRFINNALAIQCLSEEERKNTLFRTKKVIGTNGVNIPLEKKNFEYKKGEGLVFLYIGRLDIKVKGLDFLIEAVKNNAAILKRNRCVFKIFGPDVKGRGEQLKELIISYGVSDLVKQFDSISGEEKKSELLNSDIFILTSRHEGMPIGILEALSYGIPCFVTKGTSFGEWIAKNDAGWVAENSVESVTAVMRKIIIEKDRIQQKGNNAYSCVKKDYAWDRIARDTIIMYKHLITGNEFD